MSWECGSQKPRKNTLVSNKEILEKKGFLDEREAKLLFYQFLRNNISFSASLLMGIELFPFQHIGINSMLKSDYSLCVWSRGLSKCTHINSLVSTNYGMKMVGDVNVGDKILAKNGYCLVEDKVVNEEQKTYKVTSQKGYESEGLDYHRVLVLNKDLTQTWKFSKDLSIGDCLIMRKNAEFPEQIDIFDGFVDFSDNRSTNVINPKGASLASWYYFFGLFMGDGHFGDKCVKITSADQEIGDFLYEFASSIGIRIHAYCKKDALAKDYTMASKSLKSFLIHCGFVPRTKAFKKTIPVKLLQASKDNLCLLLRGFFDTDGYVATPKTRRNTHIATIGFTSSSYDLIKQIRFLLLQLGIVSKTGVTFKGGDMKFGDKIYQCNKAWSIIITSYDNTSAFAKNIGFLIKRKQALLDVIKAAKYVSGEFSEYIPYIGEYLISKMNKKSICLGKQKGGIKLNFRKNTSKRLGAELVKYVDEDSAAKINALLDPNLFFDTVAKIEEGSAVTVDLQVQEEHCYVSDGFINHNSFSAGICAGLDAVFSQGISIGILSSSYRQSKMIFRKIEEIAAKPEAYLFRQAITNVRHGTDAWELEIGRSRITALPLGDGEKLRGYRFNRIYIDEFLLMPERIVTEVLSPFLAVVQDPQKRKEVYDLETKLIERGEMKEEDRYHFESNKLIALSSASYKFEYLYKLYQQYENLILNPKSDNNAKRCIIQLSYDCAPKHLYDQNQIDQAKATMSEAQFQREYGAQFTDESSGFFSARKIMACTIPDGETPSVEAQGDPSEEYIAAIDPSWAENSNSDDFSVQILKINKEKQITTLVHTYAISGSSLRDHIAYFYYLVTNFNIVAYVYDYNGGLVFMNSCNESELFRSKNIQFKVIETEFDKPEEYQQNLIKAKSEYNRTLNKTVFMRKPTSSWIRVANEQLQGSIDHGRIFFASPAIDGQFRTQTHKDIDVGSLKYRRKTSEEESLDNVDWEVGAKQISSMIDFLEHIHDMIRLTKTQLSMIVPTTSVQGTQSFDLPKNLKGSGKDRARKDCYSALVLGNWISKIYFDMQSVNVEETDSTFTPMMI